MGNEFLSRLLKNSSWGLTANLITAVSGIVQVGFVTRLLGVESFGELTVIMAFPMLVHQFAGFRTGEFVVKYSTLSLTQEKRQDVGKIALVGLAIDCIIASLTVIIVWVGGGLYLTHTLGDSSYASLLNIYLFAIVPGALLPTSQGLLRVYNRFNVICLLSAVCGVLRLSFVYLVYVNSAGLRGVVIAYTATAVFNALFCFSACIWESRKRIEFVSPMSAYQLLKKEFRRYMSFLSAGYLEAGVLVASRNLDVILLANIGGVNEVGLYRAGKTTISFMDNLLSPLTQAILPDIQRYIKLPKAELRRRVFILTLLVGGGFTVVGGLFVLLVPFFLESVMGSGFTEATLGARIMVGATVVSGLFFWLSPFVISFERQWVRFCANIAGVITQFGVLWVAVPEWGHIGAASAYFALFAVYHLLMLVWVSIFSPISIGRCNCSLK